MNIFTVAQEPNSGPGRLVFEVSRSHTIRHTPGSTPLYEWWTLRRGRCLHNTHKGWTSVLSVGFKPPIPAIKRPQTYALDCTVTGIA